MYLIVKCMVNAISNGANRVIELHRESIGHLRLDSALAPGEWRHLTKQEVLGFNTCSNDPPISDSSRTLTVLSKTNS